MRNVRKENSLCPLRLHVIFAVNAFPFVFDKQSFFFDKRLNDKAFSTQRSLNFYHLSIKSSVCINTPDSCL
jgi:hypothetical protein